MEIGEKVMREQLAEEENAVVSQVQISVESRDNRLLRKSRSFCEDSCVIRFENSAKTSDGSLLSRSETSPRSRRSKSGDKMSMKGYSVCQWMREATAASVSLQSVCEKRSIHRP